MTSRMRHLSNGTVDRLQSRRGQRGVAVLEVTVALAALVIMAMLLLKATLNVTLAQRWTIVQGMTDTFMTQETAIARRVPFVDITGGNAGWPISPARNTQTVVVGRMPGGVPMTATLVRTRVPNVNNLASDWGLGTSETNPAKMEIWQLQSFLTYEIGGRDYVKSRTIVRSR